MSKLFFNHKKANPIYISKNVWFYATSGRRLIFVQKTDRGIFQFRVPVRLLDKALLGIVKERGDEWMQSEQEVKK